MIRTAFRVVCWVAFVPPAVIFGSIGALCLLAAVQTRAVPPS